MFCFAKDPKRKMRLGVGRGTEAFSFDTKLGQSLNADPETDMEPSAATTGSEPMNK